MIIKNFSVSTTLKGDFELTVIQAERKTPAGLDLDGCWVTFTQNRLEMVRGGVSLVSIINIPFFHQQQIEKNGFALRFKDSKSSIVLSYGRQEHLLGVG